MNSHSLTILIFYIVPKSTHYRNRINPVDDFAGAGVGGISFGRSYDIILL
jgi:hypothetical protein